MKIEMQISSKYLTYLINNCIKIESEDNKDLHTFCIYIHCQHSCTSFRNVPVYTAGHKHVFSLGR